MLDDPMSPKLLVLILQKKPRYRQHNERGCQLFSQAVYLGHTVSDIFHIYITSIDQFQYRYQ
jgi:hypothetical protein